MKRYALVLVLVVLAVLVGCKEHEHSWKLVDEKTPSCVVAGEKKYVCISCGAEKVDVVSAPGHVWNLVGEKAPTLEAAGEKRYECATCGASKVDVVHALKKVDLAFLDAYEANATKVPEGFSFTDSDYDPGNTGVIERKVRIASKEALLYYAYKFDREAAHNACTNHGDKGKSYCIWYQNSMINSDVKYVTNVYLDCDIDFEGEVLPSAMKIYGTTLKGQGHVISNAYVYGTAEKADEKNGNAGLFWLGEGGGSNSASIEDLKVNNVHVETSTSFNENAHAGILVSIGTTSVSNVVITNSSVKGGKYTGAIAGFVDGGSITGCTVENCSVSGQYKIGGAVGQIGSGDGDVKGNSFKDVSIKVEDFLSGKTAVVGKVVGYYNCNGECSGNSFDGSLPEGASEWIGFTDSGKKVTGTN